MEGWGGGYRQRVGGGVAVKEPPDVRNVGAIRGLALNVDLPGAAVEVEVVDIDAAQGGLQRGEYVADIEAERLRLGAVDVEIDRRIGRREGREHARQPRVLVGGADQAHGDAAHRAGILALQRLDLI